MSELKGMKVSEHVEQKTLIQWSRCLEGRYPVLSRLFAIPNGGHRNKAVAKKLKAEGVKRGVPDLCLPYPTGKYHGLYIEMKRVDGGSATKEQKEYITFLRSVGYRAEVCRGWVAAAGLIVEYLGLPESVRP